VDCAEVYLHTKWDLDPSSRLATTNMGRKLGVLAVLLFGGSPSNRMWPGRSPTSVPSGILIHPAVWLQYMGRKVRDAVPPFFGWGAGSHSHLTQCRLSRGPTPYQVISWSIQPFTTDMGRKLGAWRFWGQELGPHLTQCGGVEAYFHAKFHPDPTVWPQYTNITDRSVRTTVR